MTDINKEPGTPLISHRQMCGANGQGEHGRSRSHAQHQLSAGSCGLVDSLLAVLVNPPLDLRGRVRNTGRRVPGLDLNNGAKPVGVDQRVSWFTVAAATSDQLSLVHKVRNVNRPGIGDCSRADAGSGILCS